MESFVDRLFQYIGCKEGHNVCIYTFLVLFLFPVIESCFLEYIGKRTVFLYASILFGRVVVFFHLDRLLMSAPVNIFIYFPYERIFQKRHNRCT